MQDEKSDGQEREIAGVNVPVEGSSQAEQQPEGDSSPQTSCAQCSNDFVEGEEVFEDEEGNLFCSEECQESYEHGV